MDLTIREAAALTGLPTRTLRARLAAGKLTGKKKQGRWTIPREVLPLTEVQRHQLEERAAQIQESVARVIVAARSRTAAARNLRRVESVESFRRGRVLLEGLRDRAGEDAPAVATLRNGLVLLAAAVHAFDREQKLGLLREARSDIARCVGLLLLQQDEAEHASARSIEEEVLPPLAGLIRWTERLRSTSRDVA